jgi:hypothetical protein
MGSNPILSASLLRAAARWTLTRSRMPFEALAKKGKNCAQDSQFQISEPNDRALQALNARRGSRQEISSWCVHGDRRLVTRAAFAGSISPSYLTGESAALFGESLWVSSVAESIFGGFSRKTRCDPR